MAVHFEYEFEGDATAPTQYYPSELEVETRNRGFPINITAELNVLGATDLGSAKVQLQRSLDGGQNFAPIKTEAGEWFWEAPIGVSILRGHHDALFRLYCFDNNDPTNTVTCQVLG